jgi:hypothetical protein
MAVQDNFKESIDDVTPEGSTKVSSNDVENDKAAFLSSFTAAENKAIMRKVDKRFLLVIGMMYLIKNVRALIANWHRSRANHYRLITKMLPVQRFYKSVLLGIS